MTAEAIERKRWAALYVLCASVLMIVLDATIVNVALRSIQEDLGFSQTSLAWVVNAYLIAFGGLLLLAGRIGDLIGQRRIFLIGLTVFTSASLLCALAQSEAWLITARFIQGAGGALTSAVVLGMIVTMFPEPKEQAKAIGVYGFVASGGGSVGLLAGGFLTEISWHWIFLINVPLGIITGLLALRLVEDKPGIGAGQGADLPGALLLVSGPDDRHVLDPRRLATWVGFAADARPRSGVDRAAGRLHLPPVADREPADAAAPVQVADGRGRQRDPGAARRRHVRDVLPGRAVPAARAPVHADPGRPRLPADHGRDGSAVAEGVRAVLDPVRHAGDPDPELDRDRSRAAAVRAHARGRELLRRRPAGDAVRRRRGRASASRRWPASR